MDRGPGRHAYLAAALAGAAVLASAGCSGPSGHPSRAANTTASAQSARCAEQPSERADLLALQVTAALQRHDKNALLALGTGAARTAMSSWYDNAAAIGFSTAGAGDAAAQSEPIESGPAPATQPVTLDIGLHNAFDQTLGPVISGDKPEPDAPATQYRLGTEVRHDHAGHCHLLVSSWTSVNHAPWDAGQHLYVVKRPRVVVAGDPAEAADVRRVAAAAQRAADFLFRFYKSIKSSGDIELSGFLVFVPRSDAETRSWFSFPDGKRPSGWIADVGKAAGYEHPLAGVQLPVTRPYGAPRVSAVSPIGGGRVVITRAGLRDDDRALTAILVHEFTHDIYNNYDDGWFSGKPVDPALAEGAARYVETFYRISPDPTAKNVHSMTLLAPVIRQHFAGFTGHEPTRSQIYGTAALADYYYDLAASSFSYLAYRYGIGFAFQSIRDAYANGGGPFDGVLVDNRGGRLTFGDSAPYEAAWARWLRRQI